MTDDFVPSELTNLLHPIVCEENSSGLEAVGHNSIFSNVCENDLSPTLAIPTNKDEQIPENVSSSSSDDENNIYEQDIKDALFEAGYSIEEIDTVIASRPEHTLGGITSGDCSELDDSESSMSESDTSEEEPLKLLKEIRIKNINKLMIGTLNINGLASKFDQLKEILEKQLDVLMIQETKLDSSFPAGQFTIQGYSQPYRLDRNRFGGGVIIYVKENIPSKCLNKHNFTKPIEGLFVEINLRKTKLLLFGGYRSEHVEHGTCAKTFFHEISLALDRYSTYEKILLAGDFNIKETNPVLEDFLYEHSMKSIVKENRYLF